MFFILCMENDRSGYNQSLSVENGYGENIFGTTMPTPPKQLRIPLSGGAYASRLLPTHFKTFRPKNALCSLLIVIATIMRVRH